MRQEPRATNGVPGKASSLGYKSALSGVFFPHYLSLVYLRICLDCIWGCNLLFQEGPLGTEEMMAGLKLQNRETEQMGGSEQRLRKKWMVSFPQLVYYKTKGTCLKD